MIKISTLNSSLHNSTAFDLISSKYISEIEAALGQKIETAELSDYDCDLKLIFISSGGSEGLFLANFDKLKSPYIILTQGTNNSLAASMEIMTYLNNHNYEGEILHGTINYIANRINELLSNISKSTSKTDNNTISKTINIGKKYGVVGKPSDWLIASIPDYKKVEDNFGIKLVDIPLDEVIDTFSSIEGEERIENGLDFGSAEKCAKAIEAINEKHGLDGLTIRCFDLLSSIKTTGCLGLANLNTKGKMGACEGDIMSLITMGIVKHVTNQSAFQCNPSVIDSSSNTIVLAHCTIPFDMLDCYKYDTHYESKIGVAIKGYLNTSDITILRISSDLKSYFVAEGMILQNLEETELCRTQIKVKIDDDYDISSLLKNPCGNHHIVFYGRHASKIKELLG